MRLLHSKSVNLATLLTVMAVALIAIITLSSSVILHSDYQFNKAALQRSETILSAGLLKGAMPLAVAANDLQLVKSIVHDHLAFEEIYAVEVRTTTGETLYREEKGATAQVNILAKTFDLVSPYKSLDIDRFEGSENADRKILGNVTIYFSTERIHDKVKQQLYFTGGVIGSTILLCIALIIVFNRYISRKLVLVLDLMQAIKEGKPIQSWRKPVGVSELAVIDSALRDMANTIYERDNELKISLENAVDAKMVAQQAEEFKDDFIRAISHDIKTPVGVVVNLLELINDDAIAKTPDTDLLQKIAACYQSARILLDVTNELFDLEQFQRRELINKVTETHLNDLFEKITALYQQKFMQKGLIFKVSHRNPINEISEHVLVDESKLILILENIIDNALKFTKEGIVSLVWEFNDDLLRIAIKDSGIGIPEDKLLSIFEKHKQLGELATNRHEGRGLGLYYVKRLINVMGANLIVTSKPGLGTIFDLTIPVKNLGDVHADLVSRELESLSILIIDDDEGTCIALQGTLKKLGLESAYECIPEIGLSRLIKEKPDLVFIDYHMPNTSGDQIAIHAQQLLPPDTSFYVCITAEASEVKLRELENIFQVVLKKPFNTERIRNIIERAMFSKTITSKILSKMAGND